MTTLPPNNDDRELWDTWLSIFRLPVVTVADQIGTFLALSERALTTEDLAAHLKVNARALKIHLGFLAALGFVERRESRWSATALTRTWLHPRGEGYYAPAFYGLRQWQPMHGELMETLKTGSAPRGHQPAMAEWERGDSLPGVAPTFTGYMNANSMAAALALARQPIFGEVRALLDVGGGSGIFPIQVAKVWPDFRATVLEIAPVCPEADQYIQSAGVADRVKTQATNMFTKAWPEGYDAVFFSNVFHDWPDDTCQMLADKAFATLPAGGRVLVHEMLMDDDGCGPLPVAAFAMLMLLITKGRQYSMPEIRVFLERAGFRDIEAWRTGGGYYSLISGRKP
jgi:3-hydroxy-5-methyl-1-naphthoate 3-O-methyltransferase